MSAFIVSKAHIDYLVTAAVDCRLSVYHMAGVDRAGDDTRDEWGRRLLAENYNSVNYRYGEDEKPEAYKWARIGPACPVSREAGKVLKQIDCYEYQACDHPCWEKSWAYSFCRAMRNECIRHVPGYEKAPWGIPEDEPAATQVALSDL